MRRIRFEGDSLVADECSMIDIPVIANNSIRRYSSPGPLKFSWGRDQLSVGLAFLLSLTDRLGTVPVTG